MATFQSQIDILAKAIINLDKSIPHLKLIQLSPPVLKDAEIPQFQKELTYAIGMDLNKNNLSTCAYSIELTKNTSTIENPKIKKLSFDYYTPSNYKLKSDATLNVGDFFKNCTHMDMTDTPENITVLFNFSDIIPTPTSSGVVIGKNLDKKSIELDDNNNNKETISSSNLVPADINEIRTIFDLQDDENFNNELNTILRNNKRECIDLVNENFQSILYSNVYELTKNNKINFKEFQTSKHKNKKQIDLNDLKNKYILECVNNKIYYFV